MAVASTISITVPVDEVNLPPGDWPEHGGWTVADWERLPDDGNRYEIIDGVLYVTTAPSAHHQWVSLKLSRLLDTHLAGQIPPLGILYVAPFGVILPAGAVQPDLVYFNMRKLSILTEKRIVGVPDLLIEIASPGTAAYDRREKQDAYAQSGVPEYWWVNPGSRTIEVLVLENEGKYRPLALVEGQATIPSRQLPGLSFPVDSIFMPPELLMALPRE
jgi:Uma2 family endonuclease